MPLTQNYGWDVPDVLDVPNGPAQIKSLGDQVDATVKAEENSRKDADRALFWRGRWDRAAAATPADLSIPNAEWYAPVFIVDPGAEIGTSTLTVTRTDRSLHGMTGIFNVEVQFGFRRGNAKGVCRASIYKNPTDDGNPSASGTNAAPTGAQVITDVEPADADLAGATPAFDLVVVKLATSMRLASTDKVKFLCWQNSGAARDLQWRPDYTYCQFTRLGSV